MWNPNYESNITEDKLADLVSQRRYYDAKIFIREHLDRFNCADLWEKYRGNYFMKSIVRDICQTSYEKAAHELDELSRLSYNKDPKELQSYLDKTLKSGDDKDIDGHARLAARYPQILDWFLENLGEKRSLIDNGWLFDELNKQYRFYPPLVEWLIDLSERSAFTIDYKNLLENLADVDAEKYFIYVLGKMLEKGKDLTDQDYCDLLNEAKPGRSVHTWLLGEIKWRKKLCEGVNYEY